MSKAVSSSPAGKKQHHLLVVDDDEAFVSMLCEYLDEIGYSYETAANGLEALEKVAKFPFPLVLTDMQMPELNGLQLIKRLRKHSPATDIIVMTGFGQSFGLSEAINAGAIDYITKPFLLKEFEAKLKRVFRERQLQDAFKDAMNTRKKEKEELRSSLQQLETRLKEQRFELNETNTALRVMLRQREHDQRELMSDLSARIQRDIFPHIQKLKNTPLSEKQKNLIDLISMHLKILFSSERQESPLRHEPLTPTENRISNLIKQQKSSKEIAELLNISTGTVRSHRENIRKKLRITNKKKNLYKTLLSLP
jgi:DNA-binding NarL/FixJ family response regulator